MSVSLTITNNTDQVAYYLVWGSNGADANSSVWSYLADDGTLTPFPTPKKEAGASVDFTQDIPSLAAGATKTFKKIPQIWSGNVFFSFGERPKLFAIVPAWGPGGAPSGKTVTAFGGFGVQTPSFMPGAQDENTLFSSSEFTYDDSGISADTTCVDHFTAPITVTLTGNQNGTQSSGELNPGTSRDDVFSLFSGIKDKNLELFSKLIMTNGGSNIRVLAPGHGITANLFPSDYYDAYVQKCWTTYGANPLTINIPSGQYAGTYTGKVSGGELKFPADTGADCTVTTPPSKDIFLCNGNLLAPNNLEGALRARIGAAFNRTVLHNESTQPYCTSSDFYNTKDDGDSWYATNYYSALLHQAMQKVYGFPFDDVCDNGNTKPLLQDSEPTAVSFELADWAGPAAKK
jgi:hypothetical protein